MRTLRLILLLVLGSPAIACDWEVISEENGVKVSRKDVADSPVVAFRGEAELDAPAEKVMWVLTDDAHRTEWVDRCAESRVLERPSQWEQVIYQRYALPWYLSDRDYVYRAHAVRKADGSVELLLSSCEHKDAPETVGVRAKLIESRYVLIPLPNGRCKIVVEIHTDPMGMVPKWLVNVVQAEWPKKTLNGIRAQLDKPYVETCALPPAEASPAAPASVTVPASTAR